MPRKKNVPLDLEKSVASLQVDTMPSTALPQAQARIAVAKSGTLNTIIQIMINGARHPLFGKTTHPGMVRVIWNAYERKDPVAFLSSVQRYLSQAINNVPQAGKQEDVDAHILDLAELVQSAGVEEVGIRLLRGVAAAALL